MARKHVETVSKVTRKNPSKVDQLTQQIHQLHIAADEECVIARAEIGNLLQDLKNEVPHGKWMDHVRTELPYGSNTVQRAINLHHFANNHPERFAKLARAGLAKADVLINRPLPELDALLAGHHFVPSAGTTKTVTQMTFEELMEILRPSRSHDASAALVRDAKRSSKKLIKLLGSLAQNHESLDREDVVDLYDDLVHALAALASAYDLETD